MAKAESIEIAILPTAIASAMTRLLNSMRPTGARRAVRSCRAVSTCA